MASNQRKSEAIIAEKLIKDGSATASELIVCASVSRPTVIKALKPLLDSGVIIKRGVRYGFFSGCAAVFLKVNRLGGEIVGYSLGEGELERIDFQFSQMISYADNIALYAKRAEGYLDFLRKDYRKVFCSLIYSDSDGTLSLPNLFDISFCRDELLVAAFLRDYGDKLCVLLDMWTNEAVIFDSGRAVKRITLEGEKSLAVLQNIFEILAPDALVVYGNIEEDSFESFSRLCRTKGVELIAPEISCSLPIDEFEALVCLVSLVK